MLTEFVVYEAGITKTQTTIVRTKRVDHELFPDEEFGDLIHLSSSSK